MIIKIISGVIIGGAIGALLGYFGKCSSGSCPLTATPYRGAIYGAVAGLLLTSVFLAISNQTTTPPQEKAAPEKETATVPEEKPEIPKDGQEGLDAAHIGDESDPNAGGPEEKGDDIMELLTKETFLQKVFNYEQNREWKFEGELPCIIDFYADWCRLCKMIEPVLRELAQEYQGKLNIYRVDTEAERELSSFFGINSLPSLLFVPLNGQPQMAVGVLPKKSIEQTIQEVLKVE